MGIQPEKEREGEGQREREIRHGGSQISKKLVRETSPRNWSERLVQETGPSFIVQKAFYTFWLYIEINGQYKIMQCQQPWLLSRPGFFSAYLVVYTSQVIYIIFWPEGQLTFYSPFSDKGLSTRRLICLKSVVLPKVCCHSQKALSKVTFLHSKDIAIYNNERSTVIYNKEKVT